MFEKIVLHFLLASFRSIKFDHLRDELLRADASFLLIDELISLGEENP